MSKCCCCNDGPSLADDPALVFSIYAIAFIPLAFIYGLDFITDQWRTVRDTRRNGIIQLFISLPSLGSLIFYIVVQINNKDYKEAAAAIAVAGLNSIHVLRTIWGLILLYEFRNWNISVLRCLVRLGYHAPVYGYSGEVRDMFSKLKSCRSQWKRPLLRLFYYFKTKFVSVYNWSLSWIHPVSPLPFSIQSSSSSAALPDSSTGENHLRPSHESNSSAILPDSSIDGNHCNHLPGQNSFHSTLPDSTIVESQTLLFRTSDVLKTIHLHFYNWAIYKARPLCKDMKENCKAIYNWAVGNMEVIYSDSDLSLEDIKRTVDYHMVVNSSLIDNEFSNVDLPVRPAIFSRVSHSDPERHSAMARFVASCLKSRKPEECSVRWLVSFLARFGSEWLVATKGLDLVFTDSLTEFQRTERQESQNLAALASAHTTQGSVEGNGSTENLVTLHSPYHKYSTGSEHYLDAEISITQRCMLPFKLNGDFDNTVYFYLQQATIRDAAKDNWHKTSLNELDDAERSAVENITPVQLAYFSTLVEESVDPVNEGDRFFRESNEPIHLERNGPSTDILMYQLGNDTSEDFEKLFQHLPVRKEIWSSLLWDSSPNYLLLQTSVHVDNYLALDSGNRLGAYMEEYEATPLLGESELTTSVFEKQYDLELRRRQSDVAKPRDITSFSWDTPRFIGCVAETVRSILGSWVAENDSEEAGWNASIAPVGIRFKCSEQLCSAFAESENMTRPEEKQSLNMRLVWEVQAHLQWNVEKEIGRKAEDIRKSPFLILLFVLGFPALQLTNNKEAFSGTSQGHHTIEFEDGITVNPIAGPQELRIVLTCDQESKTASVIFHPESHVFKWQEWKDAFMGRLAAQKHWRSTRLLSDNELLRAEANHSEISSPVEYISREELGEDCGLSFWSGWPPFLPQITQFEIQNLVEKEYGFCYSEGFGRDSTALIRALNTAMDIHFQQRTVLETIYTDGHRAREEGRADDALRLFGYCIARLGHREALKNAFAIVMRQSPVCENQVDSLQMQMDVRFKSLLNRSQIEEHIRPVDEIDLGMLADYFGRIYDQTGSRDAGVKKALALFYENGTKSAVSEAAIEALESFIIRSELYSSPSPLLFYLAIAHQSRFHESQNRSRQEIAAKCLLGLRDEDNFLFADEYFALNIGYLLEKGFFVGRDAERKNAMIETFCEQTAWGDANLLRAIFDRLFVKQTLSEEGKKEVNDHERVFGMGKHPKDALLLYNSLDSQSNCTNRAALLYHKGAQGVPTNALDAEEAYLAAIEKGNLDALCNMGVLKSGTMGDDAGISYLISAIEAGMSTGMNNLAVAYELGNGVNRDVFEAERLYKMAIEVDNNPIAMYNLAVLYTWGDPEVRTDGNISHSQRIISDLTGPETELEPLYTLEEQVRRFALLSNSRNETVMSGKVELEELDECLAFVKILESRGESEEAGDEEA